VDLDIGQDPESPVPEIRPEGTREGANPEDGRKPKSKAPAKRKDLPQPPAKSAPIDKEKQKNVRRWERKVSEAESNVAALEASLAELAQRLAAMDPMDWKAFNEELEAQKGLETELAYAMTEWEEAQTALEEAQK